MSHSNGGEKPPRTLLEQLIRERRLTFEEFAEHAEKFARDHREPGTLSVRHLQRLAAGRRPDGRPLGPVRPATARLLERIFGKSIDRLLSAPTQPNDEDSSAELRRRLTTSRRVDLGVIELLHEQLSVIRRLDRQLGAAVVHREVKAKIAQIEELLSYSLSPDIRARLAALLSELCMLAGWQALDQRNITESWKYYERAKVAAAESGSAAFEAHTAAQQAFVLIDIGRPADAADMLTNARMKANKSPSLLRSWLAAAHGEVLAANRKRAESLWAFDEATSLLPGDTASSDGPYVALDAIHLARWRGHALACLADPEATDVLTSAVNRLDSSFARAEAALRVDLVAALAAANEWDEAHQQVSHASRLAAEIGSVRQQRRIQVLAATKLSLSRWSTHSPSGLS